MSSILQSLFPYLGLRQTSPSAQNSVRAQQIVASLFRAEKSGEAEDTVGTYGWTSNLAQAVLSYLITALESAAPVGQALQETFHRASEESDEWAHEHEVFLTIVALGILAVLVAAWVLEALGFAGLGIVEGSWAAIWQARYAGLVPNGPLFPFFERLGMTWH